MNAYFFTLTLLHSTLAFEAFLEHCDVGTVLFQRFALSLTAWTDAEISLLRARKRLLDIIPPLHALDTQRRDFAASILDYFKGAFKVVDHETKDQETKELLNIALSDIIGGYIKMWILPVVKFSYYGGTVPKKDALKLYQFHEELKRYLDSDGKGWRNPSSSFLYSLSVNIAPARQEFKKRSKDPCRDISYYEKAGNELAIPLPSINWERGSECMFIPMKNVVPISLNNPESSNELLRYYNTAIQCSEESDLESLDFYEERLQKWLSDEIVPHLNDDKMYPALYSVLSLFNQSRNLLDITEGPLALYRFPLRSHIAGFPIDMTSKKAMVITIIVLLEIVWCIPTLCYLIFTRIRKMRRSCNDDYDIETVHRNDDDFPGGGWSSSSYCTSTSDSKTASTKLICAVPSMRSKSVLSPETINYDAEVEAFLPKPSDHSIGTETHTDFASQSQTVPIKVLNRAVAKMSSGRIPPSSVNVSVATSEKGIKKKTSCEKSVHTSNKSSDSVCKTKPSVKTSSSMKSCKYNCRSGSFPFIKPCSCNCDNFSSSSIRSCKCDCTNSSYFKESTSNKLNASEIKAFCCDSKKSTISIPKSICCAKNCDCFKSIPEENVVSGSGSFVTIQSVQPTQTVTLLHGSIASNVKHNETSTDHIRRESKNNTIIQSLVLKKNVTIVDLGSSSLPQDKITNESTSIKGATVKKTSKQSVKIIPRINKNGVEKASKLSKKELTVEKGKTLLEISIDKHQLPIAVSCVSEDQVKTAKPSKIPKRIFENSLTQTPEKKVDSAREDKRRSMIPQPKRQLTVDDIDIRTGNTGVASNKLNITL